MEYAIGIDLGGTSIKYGFSFGRTDETTGSRWK